MKWIVLVLILSIVLFFVGKKKEENWIGRKELDESLEESIFGALKSLWNKDLFVHYSSKGLYEVYFTMVHIPESKEAFWIRYTLMVPTKGKVDEKDIDKTGGNSCLWFGYFNKDDPSKQFMVKKSFPLSHAVGSNAEKGEVIKIGKAHITLNGMKGEFKTKGGRSVSWNFSFSNFIKSYYPVPYFAYYLGITNTYLATGHPNLRMSGQIKFDDEVRKFDNVPGSQTHTYGDGYVEPWTWFHGNMFKGYPDAFTEFGHKTRIKKGTFGFFDSKTCHWYNGVLSMKKVNQIKKTPTEVIFHVGNDFKKEDGSTGRTIEINIRVPKENIIGLEYVGPRGNRFFCFNSEVASMEMVVRGKEGTEVYKIEDALDFETVWFEPQKGLKYLKDEDEDW